MEGRWIGLSFLGVGRQGAQVTVIIWEAGLDILLIFIFCVIFSKLLYHQMHHSTYSDTRLFFYPKRPRFEGTGTVLRI